LIHPLTVLRSSAGGALGRLGPISRSEFLTVLAVVGFMELIHFLQRKRGMRAMLAEKPIWLRWSVYYALTFAILLLGEFSKRQFIYFQF
jgi:hypothetical protein